MQLNTIRISSDEAISLADFGIDRLADWLSERGHKPSQARRILQAYYRANGELNLEKIEIGRALRTTLRNQFRMRASEIVKRHESADGTVKLLLGLSRGGTVETVLMPAYRPDRAAVCVSSQIGCAMGCDFCASTRNGLERNLEASEIVEQFLSHRREAQKLGCRIASLVFMGMGEPMHNLGNVIEAIRRISDDRLGALARRGITVSTVGVVPGIDELAEADLGVHLALSLHAPDDETRSRLVPMNRKWKVADILNAARRFFDRTGRIVTIEYCMLAGINDSDEHSGSLADLLQGFRVHVNLIPYNWIGAGISGVEYQPPSLERMQCFAGILSARGVVNHFRRARGDDVNAACGQLRHTSIA